MGQGRRRLFQPHILRHTTFRRGPDLVADFARACEALLAPARERSRIGKTPVQSLRHTRKNRAALGAGFIADRDHVRE